MEKGQNEETRSVTNPTKRYRQLAFLYAFVFVVGFMYTFGVFDSFTTSALSAPKDYKTEELQNLESVRHMQNPDFSKLVDEAAELFVNEVTEEEAIEAEAEEETPVEEVQEELVGEEF